MSIFSVKDTFGKEIEAIYYSDKFQSLPIIKRGFASINNIPKNSVLFVGINPSYSDGIDYEGVGYYDLTQSENDYKIYFGKFELLAKAAGVKWGHMDLLFVRETKQSLLDDILDSPIGVDFIWQQLQVSKKILEASAPKMLIVSNTKARHFLGRDIVEKNGKFENVWLGYNFEFDEGIGTYRIKNIDSVLFNTPVFFTSMLTGQRALDNGSFRRLEWHIKFVLKNDGVMIQS